MYFRPTHKFDIINESDYEEKMSETEALLSQYVHSGTFTSFDNTNMHYEYFLSEEGRASVIVVHGYTEFTKKYYELSLYMLEMGYNVFLYDLRGHGFSHRDLEDTEITHVNNFEDYVKDLDCFINKIVLPASNAPIYIFSHSMGAAISALYLSAFPEKVEKAILSSPMIYPVCPPLPCSVMRRLLKREAQKNGWDAKFIYSSDFNPDVTLHESQDLSYSRFRRNLNMRINELKYRNTSSTNRWNYEALGVRGKIFKRKKLKNIAAEVLIMTAGKDTVVKLPPQKRLAKILKCQHILFPDAKHSMYTMSGEKMKEYISAILNFFK